MLGLSSTNFYEGRLLVPNANTLMLHSADNENSESYPIALILRRPYQSYIMDPNIRCNRKTQFSKNLVEVFQGESHILHYFLG